MNLADNLSASALSSTAWDVGRLPCLFLPKGFDGTMGSVTAVSNVPSSSSIALAIVASLFGAFFALGETDTESMLRFGKSGRRA